MQGIAETDFQLPFSFVKRKGKVRDVYVVEDQILTVVATDRVSAFDAQMPFLAPGKGAALNLLSAFFFRETNKVAPNHLLAVPHAQAMLGLLCDVYPVEVIVRGHLCGHAWRLYEGGERKICGVDLPDGLRENDPLPEPVVTPTTKSLIGRDADITEQEITKSGLIPGDEWGQIKHFALALFAAASKIAMEKGLLLADTKFEFGAKDFQVYVIDEIFTPDSSRYFIAEGFAERQADGAPQEQYSKEFLRKKLLAKGFKGDEGQELPDISAAEIQALRDRYAQVFARITGQELPSVKSADKTHAEMEAAVIEALKKRFE